MLGSEFVPEISNEWCIPFTTTLMGHPENFGTILKRIDVFLGGFVKRASSYLRVKPCSRGARISSHTFFMQLASQAAHVH